MVWGGDAKCEHEWVKGKTLTSSGGKGHKQDSSAGSWFTATSGHCQKCNAWRGQLGLEPQPDCGRSQDEVILKDDLSAKDKTYVIAELIRLGII
jgi:hypothetical protein